MVNTFASFHTHAQAPAEEMPIDDMGFLLFLAESVISDKAIVTPLDLQAIDFEQSATNEKEIINTQTNEYQEAAND
jgi:hypothetical protein